MSAFPPLLEDERTSVGLPLNDYMAESPALHALRVDVERIDRVARRHEQAVAQRAAEADVGAALGQLDEADRLAGRVEHLHAVLLRVAHAPAAPQIARDVDAEAVRRAARLRGD